MHPVLLILLTWFVLDMAVVALAIAAARQNSRRRAGGAEMVEQARPEMVEQARLYAES